MTKHKLLELLKNMDVNEKIGQLLQLSGAFYSNSSDVVTGPMKQLGITQEAVYCSGSTLNVVGAKEVIKTQQEYLDKSKHKIPLLFMADVINGYKTIFPIPLGLACSFSPELVKECSCIAAKEASISGVHVTFSPMVDLVRDPRWGRVMESTGEDSYLNSLYGKAMVYGYQGESLLDEGTLGSCVKHFAAYGAPAGGRDYNEVEIAERLLRQIYLPAYKATVEAGCLLVMSSFNTLNGIPATGNTWLMRNVLRKEWNFDGVVISDYAAIAEMITHGFAQNEKEAAKYAMEAGIDIDMMTSIYVTHVKTLIEEGKLQEESLNEAVLRILELKNKLGLFDNPIRFASEKKERELLLCGEHRELARRAVSESIVLLKNNGLLPLKGLNQKIAFIGPYVDNSFLCGAWSMFGSEKDVITLKQGVLNRQECGQVSFEEGCKLLDDEFWFENSNQWTKEEEEEHIRAACRLAKENDVVVLALGEHRLESGEGSSKADITLPKVQMDLFRKVCEVNSNVVVVLFNGRPIDLVEINQKASGVVEAWFPGTEGGNGIADVLYGDKNPSGRLTMSFPYHVGQIPVYYNHYKTGRPSNSYYEKNRYSSRYLDIPNEPLYPFGYGLSYTDFAYSNLSLSSEILTKQTTITASVMVKNIGKVSGEETVQLYIQDESGSVVRPVKELKGFQKVSLLPDEEKEIRFVIEEEMLCFYGADMKLQSEPGQFRVYIGRDSRENDYRCFSLCLG